MRDSCSLQQESKNSKEQQSLNYFQGVLSSLCRHHHHRRSCCSSYGEFNRCRRRRIRVNHLDRAAAAWFGLHCFRGVCLNMMRTNGISGVDGISFGANMCDFIARPLRHSLIHQDELRALQLSRNRCAVVKARCSLTDLRILPLIIIIKDCHLFCPKSMF